MNPAVYVPLATTPWPWKTWGSAGPSEDPWGVTVIEGGAEMDEFSKSALLSLAPPSCIWMRLCAREALSVQFRRCRSSSRMANKVLSGVDAGSASDRDTVQRRPDCPDLPGHVAGRAQCKCFLHAGPDGPRELPAGIFPPATTASSARHEERPRPAGGAGAYRPQYERLCELRSTTASSPACRWDGDCQARLHRRHSVADRTLPGRAAHAGHQRTPLTTRLQLAFRLKQFLTLKRELLNETFLHCRCQGLPSWPSS